MPKNRKDIWNELQVTAITRRSWLFFYNNNCLNILELFTSLTIAMTFETAVFQSTAFSKNRLARFIANKNADKFTEGHEFLTNSKKILILNAADTNQEAVNNKKLVQKQRLAQKFLKQELKNRTRLSRAFWAAEDRMKCKEMRDMGSHFSEFPDLRL